MLSITKHLFLHLNAGMRPSPQNNFDQGNELN